MKKKLVLVLTLLSLLLTTVACGSSVTSNIKHSKDSKPSETSELSETSEPSSVVMEETQVLDSKQEELQQPEVIQWTNAEIEENVLWLLDKEEGDTVTVEEAATITGVYDYGNGQQEYFALGKIKDCDMSDLKYLTSLEAICLADKKMDDIGIIRYLPALKYLKIYSEELTDLSPLKNNTMLENLTIETYGLENLNDLAGMTNLKKLSISSDILSDVSMVGQLTSLTELYLKSNTLQSLGIDFTNMLHIVDITINCDVLTDLTCFSTLQSGVTVYNGDVNVHFYNDETSVTEESARVIGQVRYDSLVLAGKYGYDTSFVDFNNTVNGDAYGYYRELISQYGVPEIAIIEEWMPEPPSVTIPDTWEDITIDFDGQLLTVPCSLQSLFDYGYQIEDTVEIDLTDRLRPKEEKWYKLHKDTGAKLTICVENTDTERAIAEEDCPVTLIRIMRSQFSEDNLPELFLPTDLEQRRKWEDRYGNYISWDDYKDSIVSFSVGTSSEKPSTITKNLSSGIESYDSDTSRPVYAVSNRETKKSIHIYVKDLVISKIELVYKGF